jgi:hypothetical protein
MSMKAVSLFYRKVCMSLGSDLNLSSLEKDRKKSVKHVCHLLEYISTRSLRLIDVISGDSLVLRGRPGQQGQLPKER